MIWTQRIYMECLRALDCWVNSLEICLKSWKTAKISETIWSFLENGLIFLCTLTSFILDCYKTCHRTSQRYGQISRMQIKNIPRETSSATERTWEKALSWLLAKWQKQASTRSSRRSMKDTTSSKSGLTPISLDLKKKQYKIKKIK